MAIYYEAELKAQIEKYKSMLSLALQDEKSENDVWYYKGCLEGSQWLLRSYICGADRDYILYGLIRKNYTKKISEEGSRDKAYWSGYCFVIRHHLYGF